jgi:hypothetical protein
MAAATSQPPAQTDAGVSKKKKVKANGHASSASSVAAPAEPARAASPANGAAGYESPYVKELYK